MSLSPLHVGQFGNHRRLAGRLLLLWLLGLLVAGGAACGGGPVPTPRASNAAAQPTFVPQSLSGIWQLAAGRSADTDSDRTLLLLFGAAGEFRSASARALLYDAPTLSGSYTLSGDSLVIEETGCAAPGRFSVFARNQASGQPLLTILLVEDPCTERAQLLGSTIWTRIASEDAPFATQQP